MKSSMPNTKLKAVSILIGWHYNCNKQFPHPVLSGLQFGDELLISGPHFRSGHWPCRPSGATLLCWNRLRRGDILPTEYTRFRIICMKQFWNERSSYHRAIRAATAFVQALANKQLVKSLRGTCIGEAIEVINFSRITKGRFSGRPEDTNVSPVPDRCRCCSKLPAGPCWPVEPAVVTRTSMHAPHQFAKEVALKPCFAIKPTVIIRFMNALLRA